MSSVTTPHQILKKHWGYDEFRPLQEDIIKSVLTGKDTLALLPTGGGKSICFQVPALLNEGICLVVSPLIALMKDQVHNLVKRGIKAEAIYSGMKYRQMDSVFNNCVFGNVKFLYVSPERLATEDFKLRVQQMKVNLIAVDEAHCISQWGYDFRPPYMEIAKIRELLKNIPVIALTATATPKVVLDIQDKLLFKQNNVFQKSFVRSNLSYVVRKTWNKEKSLTDILQKVKGTAIVYVRSRKLTKQYAELLIRNKVSADFYHAGLEPADRTKKQENWLNNKTRVICCTNAFGMGIDKPDVRVVIHLDPPDSLEAYFQEAGRAGRDEKRAYAVLLTQEDDVQKIISKLTTGFPEISLIREVYEQLFQENRIALHEGSYKTVAFDIAAFAAAKKMNVTQVLGALKILQQQKLIYLQETPTDNSEIKLICDRNQLYDIMDKNKTVEPILKMMLRTMEGLFEDYVYVEEWLLAHRLEVAESKVYELLEKLHQLKVVDYKRKIDKPHLTFLQDRVASTNLRLDVKFIEARKADFQEKLKAVSDYINNQTICRTQMLVRYFGERNAPTCGVCDICLAKKKSGLSVDEFSSGVNIISNLLKERKQPLDKIFSTLNLPEKKTEELISFMLNNGTIITDNDGNLELVR